MIKPERARISGPPSRTVKADERRGIEIARSLGFFSVTIFHLLAVGVSGGPRGYQRWPAINYDRAASVCRSGVRAR